MTSEDARIAHLSSELQKDAAELRHEGRCATTEIDENAGNWYFGAARRIEEAIAQMAALTQALAEARQQLDDHKYYCPNCGACGEPECCAAPRCAFFKTYTGLALEEARQQLQVARAEVNVLRGVHCCADGDGPCGVCLKCARAEVFRLREALRKYVTTLEDITAEEDNDTYGKERSSVRADIIEDLNEILAAPARPEEGS